jgi:hypothetical protein
MGNTSASHLTQTEHIGSDFSVIKSDKKAKMDYEFPNARIKGGHPFSPYTSTEWDPFWKAAFVGAGVPPHRNIVSSLLLVG